MILKIQEFLSLRYPVFALIRFSLAIFSISFLFASCRNPDGENLSGDEYIEKMAEGLPQGSAVLLDSVASEIRWSIRQNKGSSMSGIFKPDKGCLLIEGTSVSAGFWEGDFFQSNFITDSSTIQLGAGLKFLKDSVPALFRQGGNLLRMDLRQISRVIPRSEFRGNSIADSLFPSHDVSIQAEIADSSQNIRVPLRIVNSSESVRITGFFQLNLRDFGILPNPVPPDKPDRWVPEARLDFRLIFRKPKKINSAPDAEKS
jgi:hypothetical protein